MKNEEMTCVVETVHSVDSFVELVALMFNNYFGWAWFDYRLGLGLPGRGIS
jgi:hypothetical protein